MIAIEIEAAKLMSPKRSPGESDMSSSALILLEHINLNIVDPVAAEDFFVNSVGCVRNPRGSNDRQVHFNLGACQFHMPYRLSVANMEPVTVNQVWPGELNLWIDNLQHAFARLQEIGMPVRREENEGGNEEMVLSWHGTLLKLVQSPHKKDAVPLPGFHPGGTTQALHMPVARHRIACGTAEGLVRWYRCFLWARAELEERSGCVRSCVVHFDNDPLWPQKLIFDEDSTVVAPVDGEELREEDLYHICVYLKSAQLFKEAFGKAEAAGALFVNERFEGGPIEFASARNWEEAERAAQYRLRDMRDPLNGLLLLRLEHEVRKPEHKSYPLRLF